MKTRTEKTKSIMDKFNMSEDEATIIMLEQERDEL